MATINDVLGPIRLATHITGVAAAVSGPGTTATTEAPINGPATTFDHPLRRKASNLRMRWTSFFYEQGDVCGNRSSPFFCCRATGYSSVPAADASAAARLGGQGWPRLRPPAWP